MKILELAKEERIRKGEHLLSEGQRCYDLFFVTKGILRVYYLKDGQDITDWFGTSNTIITALESFHSQIPSDQYIQAVIDTEILRISKLDLKKAIENSKEMNAEYLTLLTEHLMRVQQRIKALQFYTAKERYNLLIEKNPDVVKFVKRSQIASYLGITLETLSRVTSI
jgi:CRP-like cAMP-binding protein